LGGGFSATDIRATVDLLCHFITHEDGIADILVGRGTTGCIGINGYLLGGAHIGKDGANFVDMGMYTGLEHLGSIIGFI